MTTRQAEQQAARLNTDSECVRLQVRTGMDAEDALALERLETILFAEDLPVARRRVIERTLQTMLNGVSL